MSDVMHGPSVLVADRTKRKTYLVAFIYDATRVIPYAVFTLAENTRAFLPALKQAILRRGLPECLYVDNGANCRSQRLARVCAKLGLLSFNAQMLSAEAEGGIAAITTATQTLVNLNTALDLNVSPETNILVGGLG
jgi:hypothetical protein